MIATQRHPTRRASRVARSKRVPRVSTKLEYKWPLLCYFSRCIFSHAIFISHVFTYNSSESGSGRNHTVI